MKQFAGYDVFAENSLSWARLESVVSVVDIFQSTSSLEKNDGIALTKRTAHWQITVPSDRFNVWDTHG